MAIGITINKDFKSPRPFIELSVSITGLSACITGTKSFDGAQSLEYFVCSHASSIYVLMRLAELLSIDDGVEGARASNLSILDGTRMEDDPLFISLSLLLDVSSHLRFLVTSGLLSIW
jgi:hypothetical protein